MRILHVSQYYHPIKGGNPLHLKELSEGLVELGEDVTVFTSRAITDKHFYSGKDIPEDLLTDELLNGVKVKRYKVNSSLYYFLFKFLWEIKGGYRLTRILLGKALTCLSYGPFAPRMFFDIIRFKPDVLMEISICSATAVYCYLAKKITNVPLVIIPCMHVRQDWADDPFIYKIMNYADRVIALTDFEKKYLIDKGIEAERISVIGAGTHLRKEPDANGDEFRNKHSLNGELVVSYVGRLIKNKGISTLIKAMDIVWNELPDVKLVLAGAADSKFAPVIKGEISTIEKTGRKNFILTENFSDHEKNDILAASDVFVLPSIHESFGIVLLEAWTHSIPCVACKDAATASVIDNEKDGLLFEYENEQELAGSILRLLKDKGLRENLGARGKEKLEDNYTWDIISSRIREEYYKLVAKEM